MSNTPATDALVAELRARGVEVLTQDVWSLMPGVYEERLRTRPHDLLPDQPVDTLVNHITVTHDDGPLVGDFVADLRELERIGWQRFRTGISYDIIVDRNAPHPRVAIGQFLEARGAHAINDKDVPGYSKDQNKVSIGLAWVGMPGNKINRHGITAMVEVRSAAITVNALTETYDDIPHSLLAYKDCPTDELRDQLPDLKRRALAGDLTPHHRQEDPMANLDNDDRKWLRKMVREELDMLLEDDMNRWEPKGEERFRGRSLRRVIKDIAIATGAVKPGE